MLSQQLNSTAHLERLQHGHLSFPRLPIHSRCYSSLYLSIQITLIVAECIVAAVCFIPKMILLYLTDIADNMRHRLSQHLQHTQHTPQLRIDSSSFAGANKTAPAPCISIDRVVLLVEDKPVQTERCCVHGISNTETEEGAPSSSPVLLLMITGNPGSCHFYVPFLTHLHTLIHPQASPLLIECFSFAGHSCSSSSSSPLYSIQDQIRLWEHIVIKHIQQDPTRKIILIGHSIGAYIALQCMQYIPEENLLQVLLLFPALFDMYGTPAGKRLSALFAYGRPVSAMITALLVKTCRRAWRERIIRWVIHRDLIVDTHTTTTCTQQTEMKEDIEEEVEHTVSTVSALMSASICKQMLYLAHTELQLVKQLPISLLTQSPRKLTFVFAYQDEWNPKEQQQCLVRLCPASTICYTPTTVKHSFVCGTCRLVAEIIAEQIRKLQP